MIRKLILMMALTCPAIVVGALPAAVDGQPLPSLAPLLEDVTPSVVNIYTRTRVQARSPLMNDPFFRRFFNLPDRPRERISQSLGSGVIVNSEEGYILTNNHVIEGADDIAVTLQDGRSLQAKLVGRDADTDLAVIRVDAEDLRALPLADSNQLRVGDFVVAVGNPFGLGQTVTSGIVSALGRAGLRGLELQNFIQTDASINPGNSGGALVNLRGELVGINSAIFTPSGGNVGIGFAIPSTMASYVMQQLVLYGEVRRGTLGLVVQDLTNDLATAFGVEDAGGVLVAEVISGSAADNAGLQPGDILLSMAGQPVQTAQEFLNAEGLAPLGQELEVELLRNQIERSADLVVLAIPQVNGVDLDPRFDGAVFTEVPSSARRGTGAGILLSELNPRSQLAFEGLREGDIVTAVNRQRVGDLEEFRLSLARQRGPLLLQLRRDGQAYIARID